MRTKDIIKSWEDGIEPYVRQAAEQKRDKKAKRATQIPIDLRGLYAGAGCKS